ncbi:MAG: Gfo/Idh/MocA family protein [Micromonosporaceae bacterium]
MRIGLVGVGRIGAQHAQTLASLREVDQLIITDTDQARARAVADRVGATAAPTVADLAADLAAVSTAGVVIAAPTPSHADLIGQFAAAGLPVFCEKPVAPDVPGTRKALALVGQADVPLQIGFQRRFDAGFSAVRGAVRAQRLGWLHTLRACTADMTPPPAEYIAASGGIFRDCAVHDFDIVRWVTGREVTQVYATGANRGAEQFALYGDVDTGVAVLTLDDGTLATCSATRYNGAGYDVRLEACGSLGTLVAGLDEWAPLVSAEVEAEPGGIADNPAERSPRGGRTYTDFMERFGPAYAAELAAFCDVVAGRTPSPCTGEDALAALLIAEAAELSRQEGRPTSIEEVS